jgi:hypothetical protein
LPRSSVVARLVRLVHTATLCFSSEAEPFSTRPPSPSQRLRYCSATAECGNFPFFGRCCSDFVLVRSDPTWAGGRPLARFCARSRWHSPPPLLIFAHPARARLTNHHRQLPCRKSPRPFGPRGLRPYIPVRSALPHPLRSHPFMYFSYVRYIHA